MIHAAAGAVKGGPTSSWSDVAPVSRGTDGEETEAVDDRREYLAEPDADEVLCLIRRETAVGGPIGSREFVRRLERALERCLTRRPPGRPRKKRPGNRWLSPGI